MLEKVLDAPPKYPVGNLAALLTFFVAMLPSVYFGVPREMNALEVAVLGSLAIFGALASAVFTRRWGILGLLMTAVPVVALSCVASIGLVALRRAGVVMPPARALPWICGSFFVTVAIVLVIYLFLPDKEREAKLRLVRENGEDVMAWIVPTRPIDMGKFYIVMVVYTFDKAIPEAAQFLEDLAARMSTMSRRTAVSPDEAEVAGWVDEFTSYAMFLSRAQVPVSLTDGHAVYCIKTYAQKEYLPQGELNVPYIYIRAHPDVPDLSVRMVPYPEPDHTADRRQSLMLKG